MLFVVEDRALLHRSDVPVSARTLYADYFSTAQVASAGGRADRRLAHRPVAGAPDRHRRFGRRRTGRAGAERSWRQPLFAGRAEHPRRRRVLPNRALLAAVRALAQIDDPVTGLPRPVDYRNLDSEELGGMYEGLLAYTPRYHADERAFALEVSTGNERKKSGSYTPRI